MAIQFQTAGAVAAGTTSLSVPYPTGITVGDMLVLCIANKYSPNLPSLPSGWITGLTNNQATGSSGSNGIDTGSATSTVFLKIADGTETGNLSVTITSGNAAVGRMFRYSKAAGTGWSYAFTTGSDNAAGTGWSAAGAANLGITANDMLIAVSAINTDGYTYSAQAISATGATFGTAAERQDSGTANGQDCGLVVSEHPVSSGTATAAPTFTMTASGSATNAPAGGTVFLRLREAKAITADNAWVQKGSSLSVTTNWPAVTALSSTRVVVFEDDGNQLRVYDWSGSAWSQVGTAFTVASAFRGGIGALDSNTIALVEGNADTLTTYTFNGSTWSQVGNSLSLGALSDPTLAVMSPTRVAISDDSSVGGSGSLRAFRWDGTNWVQEGNALSSVGQFAVKVCALGDSRVVLWEGTTDGALEVYDFNERTGNWTFRNSTSVSFNVSGLARVANDVVVTGNDGSDTFRFMKYDGSGWTTSGPINTLTGVSQPAFASLGGNDIAAIDAGNDLLRFYELPPMFVSDFPSVRLIRGRTLTADTASFVDTLYDATLSYTPIGNNKTLTCSPASFAVTAWSALFDRSIVASPRSYALSGIQAGLLKQYRLIADVRAHAITGYGALQKRTMVAAVRSYTVSYSQAILRAPIRMTASAGSFLLTAAQTGLRKTYSMTASAGNFSLSGVSTALRKTYVLAANAQSFSLGGVSAGILEQSYMNVGQANLFLTFNQANLIYTSISSYVLTASTSATTITGSQVSLRKGLILSASTAGSYQVVPNSANILKDSRMTAAASSISLGGSGASLLVGRKILISAGNTTITANVVNFTRAYRLSSAQGAFNLSGYPVGSTYYHVLVAGVGAISITGSDATLRKLTGQRVKVYVGGVWVTGVLRARIGGVWVDGRLKKFSGESWV